MSDQNPSQPVVIHTLKPTQPRRRYRFVTRSFAPVTVRALPPPVDDPLALTASESSSAVELAAIDNLESLESSDASPLWPGPLLPPVEQTPAASAPEVQSPPSTEVHLADESEPSPGRRNRRRPSRPVSGEVVLMLRARPPSAEHMLLPGALDPADDSGPDGPSR